MFCGEKSTLDQLQRKGWPLANQDSLDHEESIDPHSFALWEGKGVVGGSFSLSLEFVG